MLHQQQISGLSHTTVRCSHVDSVSACPRLVSFSPRPCLLPSPRFSADAHTVPSAGVFDQTARDRRFQTHTIVGRIS